MNMATTCEVPSRRGEAGASLEAQPAAQFPLAERPVPLTKQQAVEAAVASAFYGSVGEIARRAIAAAEAWDASRGNNVA
ncbi:MAG: hypothetical protein E6R08_04100 [Nevskiaceae bacterium]|nr:MAG: hypothetical protein E6R08_04100 [Nevskiaceae bacterium]